MTRHRWQQLIIFSLTSGGLLLLALLLLSGGHGEVHADSSTLFVKPDGIGIACTQAEPCALQTALAQAGNGDTIYLARGTYKGTGAAVITLTQSVSLYGGWDGAPSGPVVRDPAVHPTILDGEGQRRVVYISGDITPTLDGLIITGGNATGLTDRCPSIGGNPDGCGGGIFVDCAHPIIVNNIITNNVAALATQGYPTGTTGYGGGLYLRDAVRAVVSGNVIISNTASMANDGMGGGICLYGTASGLVVRGNQVLQNVAAKRTGWGGGIGGRPDGALIEDNWVEGNRTNAAGTGCGAALYQWYGSATYRNNWVQGNIGDHAVYLGWSRSLFERNVVVDNATRTGIHLVNGSGNGLILVNNAVIRSASDRYTLGAFAYAGAPLTVTLLHNTFVGGGSASGVGIGSGYVTLFLTNTIVVSHTWGITNTFPASSTVYADHTLFWANSDNGLVGSNAVFGDPCLLSDGYHVGAGSAAVDAGVDAGIVTDIDGDPRPIGAACDIGADEFKFKTNIYLPVVLRMQS